jgi:chromosome segregation ATPase
VLYLAEVQKQSKGFMGGSETKLKLLACQRNDQSWSVIPGNELIAAEEASNFGDGALVIVNLSTNRQIQGEPESASKRVIGILQGFSRLLEKTKNQEDEIEQWKESLTIQSEELSRREMEMENRLERLEQMEEEYKQLEQQREEIILVKEEAERIREEFERKSQELEGAWEQLRGEQQNLQQQRTEIQHSKVLDEVQTSAIQALIESLSSTTQPTELFPEHLTQAFTAVNAQQEYLDGHWQQLEQQKGSLQQQQQEVTRLEEELKASRHELEAILIASEETKIQLKVKQESLATKQDLAGWLNNQQQIKEELKETIARLGIESGDLNLDAKIDFAALENMPLIELQKMVERLQQDLEKLMRFVNEQEEELNCQCQTVEELEAKVKAANESDRLALEQELAEEKEAKKMLDETLVGQRRSLREREAILLQHLRILKRRQGILDLDAQLGEIDLEPLKQKLEQQQMQIEERHWQVMQEIAQLEQDVQQLQQNLHQASSQQEVFKQNIKQKEECWEKAKISVAQLQSKLDFYEKHLQPLQDCLNKLRQKLEAIEGLIVTLTENNNLQDRAIDRMRQIVQELMAIPEMSAS